MNFLDLLLLLVGAALGAALGLLSARARHAEVVATLRAEARAATARGEATEATQSRLADQFRALSADALERSGKQLLQLAEARFGQAQARGAAELDQRRQAVEHLVAPLKDTLTRVEGQLRELEQARLTAYSSLMEQVTFVRDTSEQLRAQTTALVSALRAPQARGRWGEMQLRRVVEIAGMVEHCDFEEQASVETRDGRQRPDLVVRLAGGKNVVVDAKVSLSAYLEAVATADDTTRAARLAAHARHLRAHVDELAAKSYWAAFQPTPEFVVLFVPGEAFLAPALEHDPNLLEHAMGRRVVIATPTTLITMLRTIAYSWQQAALADSARDVFELGRDLYQRLSTLGQHVDKLGRSIGRVVSDYNTAVGSLEGRVLVAARRMNELKLVDTDLPTPSIVEDMPRPLGAHELVTADVRPVRALRADA
jgi:DNA recombination protein RmuC